MAAGDATTISVLVRAKDEASAALNRIASNGEKMAAGFAKHRRAIGMAAAGMGTALAGIGVAGIKASSDLGESMNAVNVIFGDGAKVIHEFGQTSARSAGLSTASFNQLAATTGALLKDVGLPMEEVAGLTTDLTVRAADMASVMNTSVEDALSAVGQALRGETEAIRRYAGDVTDASLEHFRLSEGMQKSVKDMSEQEKRLLRLDLIMKQTNIMAGDLANTQESLANQLRVAGAEFTNVQAAIGQALVPAVEKLMTKIGPLLEKIIEWIKENPELAKWITIIAEGNGALLIPLGALLLILPGLAAGFALVSGAMLPITAVVVALAAAIAIGIVIWKNWETMGMKLKIVFAILFPPIVALIAIIKNWNTIIDKITLAFIFTKKVILDLMIVYNKVQLAVAKFTGASKEQQDALRVTISELENSKAAGDAWADNVRANAQKRIDATEEEAKVAAQAGEKTEDAQKSVIVKTLEKTGVMQDSSEKVQVAAQEETKVIEQSSQKQIDAIDLVAEATKTAQSKRFKATQELGRQIIAQADADREAREKAMADLLESMDKTTVMWNTSGDEISDVMSGVAKHLDITVGQLGQQWLDAGTDVDNFKSVLTQAHEDLGTSWFNFSNKVEKELARQENAYVGYTERMKIKAANFARDIAQSAMEDFPETLLDVPIPKTPQQTDAAKKAQEGAAGYLAAAAKREEEVVVGSQQKQLQVSIASGIATGFRSQGFNIGTGSTTVAGAIEVLRAGATGRSIAHVSDADLVNMIAAQNPDAPLGTAGQIAKLGLNIDQKMRGGLSRGGLTLVGERGPELVSLPGGSFVHRSGTGPGGQTNNFIFNGSVYGVEDLKDVVIEAVRDHAISGGFSGVFEEA